MCSGSCGPTPSRPSLLERQRVAYTVYHIPRSVKRYEFQEGETVRFRSALGKLNNETMEPVVKSLGREDLTVTQTGECDQVEVMNEQGETDIVPSVWLIPWDITDADDYPRG